MFDLSVFDYIYIGVLLASTVWATIRGGVYETLATLSWVLAALAARFISPWLDGVFQHWFSLESSTIGSLIASYFIVFFVILVIFTFVNAKIRDKVQDSVLKVTDHTLGVVFGIVRGIVLMGLVYWGMLWYYARADLPQYITTARTRPVVQLTAKKIHDWFIPGASPVLDRDVLSTAAAQEIYDNLINPAVENKPKTENQEPKTDTGKDVASDKKNNTDTGTDSETGYRDSERQSLENQLLQLEAKAEADEKREIERIKRHQTEDELKLESGNPQ